MKISPKLRYHTITFKMGIDSFVDNLDDPSCLEHEIQKISDNHFARGLRIKQFKVRCHRIYFLKLEQNGRIGLVYNV